MDGAKIAVLLLFSDDVQAVAEGQDEVLYAVVAGDQVVEGQDADGLLVARGLTAGRTAGRTAERTAGLIAGRTAG